MIFMFILSILLRYKMAERIVPFACNHVKCSICLEDFKSPKLLPCFHTFCSYCLKSYIEKNSRGSIFECPLCRASIDTPTEGVCEFQINFYIEAANELGGVTSVPCEVCGPSFPAFKRCSDCEQNICKKCTETHVLLHHSLIKLDATPKAFCEDHPRYDIVFVCKKCNKGICIVCKLTGHENHPSDDTVSDSQNSQTTRETLADVLEDPDLNNNLQQMKDLLSNMRQLEKTLPTVLGKELEEIKEYTNVLHDLVDEINQDLEEKVKEVYEKGESDIRDKTQALEKDYESATEAVEAARLILEQKSDQSVEHWGRLEKEIRDIKCIAEGNRISLPRKVFKPRDLAKDTVATLFNLSSLNNLFSATKYDKLDSQNLKLVSKCQIPGFSYITCIVPVELDTAWICGWEGHSIAKINSKGQIIKTVNVGTLCHYAAVSTQSEVMISCQNDKSIKRITTEGKIEDYMSNLDMFPQGLAYRKKSDASQELLVTSTDVSNGCGNSGTTRVEKSQKLGTPIATENRVPFGIATDPTSSRICIADYMNSEVTIHGPNGEFLARYKDYPNLCVWDVCFYNSDCILLVNEGSDVRTIQADGSSMEVLLTKSCVSVAIERERLWLGLTDGEVEVYDIV